MMKVNSFKKLCIFITSLFITHLALSDGSSWLHDSSYSRKNYIQLRQLENYLFSELETENRLNKKDLYRSANLGTHSFLMIKDGFIIYEKYDKEHHRERPQKLWSISKAVTNLLIGIAVKENKISLEDNLCKYLKDHESKINCNKITIKHLLSWSSGIHWKELPEPSIFSSSVFNLLYSKKGYTDSISFILSHPLIDEPGMVWHYSSGDTNLLMHILSKVYPTKEYTNLPWSKLFDELGIQNSFWDTDQKGIFNGCCSLYLTTRDVGLIGEFMLKKGRWMGKQFLPNGWIKNYVTSVIPSFFKKPIYVKEQMVPGFQWWVNTPSLHGSVLKPRILPSAPADLYYAIGYAGQYLFIIPSMNTIIVRTGHSHGRYLDMNAMVGMALSVITGKSYNQAIRKTPLPFVIGEEYGPPRKYLFPLRSANNFLAKEMCNCIFIEKGTKKYCQIFLKSFSSPFQGVHISRKKQMVRVSTANVPPYSRAVFNDRYGCSLL